MKHKFNHKNLITLAKKYSTPLYVYDFDYIKKQYQNFKLAFKGKKSIIAYALKANTNFALLQVLAKEESGADCVSLNEIKMALNAGIKKYNIIFSGVGKSDDEIKQALELNILLINAESFFELKTIEKIAKKLKIEARMSIRLNPDIDAKTHPYISTGLSENKFGVTSNEAKAMYIYAKKSKYLNPIGIHVHIGSQLTKLEPIKDALNIASSFVGQLKAIGVEIKFFNVGGGLGVVYENEKTISFYDYAQTIFKALGDKDLSIICEPGRSLVCNSGVLLNSVVGEKINNDKRFVIVDGGMNDLLRISLYNASHKIELLNINNTTKYENKEFSKCNIVGPVCESGDFFAKNINFPSVKAGDIVAIYSVGAYGFCMSSNYNQRFRAAEVAIFEQNTKLSHQLIRQRETFEDLMRGQIKLKD